MKLDLTINNTQRTIAVPTDAGRAGILLCEPGVYSVIVDGRACEARIEPAANGASLVTIGPHRFEIEVRDPRRYLGSARSRGASGLQNITAPMPGKVVRVLVAQGDSVEAGQGIVVVEAMKMQNEIKAQRPGRIAAMTAREGDTVAAGEMLATLE
jgi:biotin carboxyl carrier protein